MPKKTAADLIAGTGIDRVVMPSKEALAQLQIILDHNDTCAARSSLVKRDAVIEMLRGYGWPGSSETALNSVCRKLGRSSFGSRGE